jgi:hypothetical protein
MVTKKKVEIHIANEEHRSLVSFIEHPLKQNGINYTIIVDIPMKNRRYPYVTVNDRIMCMRKTINAARGCST